MEDKTGNAGKKKAQKFIKSMEAKRKETRKEAEKKRLIFCAAALVSQPDPPAPCVVGT